MTRMATRRALARPARRTSRRRRTSTTADDRLCWTEATTTPIAPPSGCNWSSGATFYTYNADTSAVSWKTDPNGDTTTYSYADLEYPTSPTTVNDVSGDNLEETYTQYDLMEMRV